MDVIHNIKIPSVHIGSVDPTTDTSLAPSGEGGQPAPITYLTQWKIVGNSEVHGNEIWSCGEYNATDGKFHILVQPQGGNVADIALTEPLRKVNNVADTIEFPSDTEGKALVTRNLGSVDLGKLTWSVTTTTVQGKYRMVSNKADIIKPPASNNEMANILSSIYETKPVAGGIGPYIAQTGIAVSTGSVISVYDENYNQSDSATAFKAHVDGVELIYELETPTTELVDAPQIEEADSYTCVISQGGKAVEWSSFETE